MGDSPSWPLVSNPTMNTVRCPVNMYYSIPPIRRQPVSENPPHADPLGEVRSRLQRLRLQEGQPSSRAISKLTGGALSASAVSRTLACENLPSWRDLKTLVEALGGRLEFFHELWLAAGG